MTSEKRQPVVRNMDGRRDRPSASRVRRVPRKDRRAELVCDRDSGRKHLLAVVYPRGAPLDSARVMIGATARQVGVDFEVPCPCGFRHQVDGARLRSELAAHSPDRLMVVRVSAVAPPS